MIRALLYIPKFLNCN